MENKIKRILIAIVIVIFGAVFRIFLNEVIAIPNFEAVTSLSLLSGSFLGLFFGSLISLGIIFLSDIYFGNLVIYFFTWSAFIVIAVFGSRIRNNKNYFLKILGSGIISVLFFYLYTNFGWWLISNMYERSFSGLIQCYIAGLAFLKNQLISVIIFIPLFLPIFSLLFRKSKVKIIETVFTASNKPFKNKGEAI